MPLLLALRGTPCGYLNINDLAQAEKSPDPETIGQKVDQYHQQTGLVSTYGGDPEGRSPVWMNVPHL